MSKLTIEHAVFDQLIADHLAKFPNALANFKRSSLCPATLHFHTTIFSKECWSNGIVHNDPMLEAICIERIGEDQYIARLDGGSLTILPTEEAKKKHLFFSSVKCIFRKTTGNAEKIIKAILKWQEKRLALVKEYKSVIPNIATSNLKDI